MFIINYSKYYKNRYAIGQQPIFWSYFRNDKININIYFKKRCLFIEKKRNWTIFIMLKDSCDSLGIRSLPVSNRSTLSLECDVENNGWRENESRSQISDREILPVTFSDVSFFRESDAEDDSRAFQRTLAIVKPEVARLMYKIENIMARNGFIIITVCTFIVITIVHCTTLVDPSEIHINENNTRLA